MYLNGETTDTNIDPDIDPDNDSFFKKIKLKINPKYFLIGIIVLILLVLSYVLIFNQKKYNIILFGEKQITVYKGSDYVDPGYQGYDNKRNDLTSKVIVSGQVNTSEIGEYQITYSLKKTKVIRKVSVVAKPIGATYISLKGELEIYLDKGEKYVEPGYTATDSIDGNITKKVVVTNNIDTATSGEYQVTYSVVNSSGITTIEKRKVNVIDSDMSLLLSSNKYTNKDVTIKISISNMYFDYLILPNNQKTTKSETEYVVTENGKYTFKMYNKKGISKESSIEVKTIDKIAPSGTCVLNIDQSSRYIIVSAGDDSSGISRYGYDGKEYTSNKIKVYNNATSANITIYDKAGNTKNITCTINKIDN